MSDRFDCKRLHNTPFLLWSDVNLQCAAHTDVEAVFLMDSCTLNDIRLALQAL